MSIREIGQIEDTIKNLTAKAQKPPKSRRKKDGPILPLQEAMPRFLQVIDGILDEYKPDEMYAERFQTRGIKGKSTELVSFMLGLLAMRCRERKIRFVVIIAGTWKNAVNRCWPLDDLYAYGKTLGFSPHEIDSMMIGLTRGGQTKPPSISNVKTLLRKIQLHQSKT